MHISNKTHTIRMFRFESKQITNRKLYIYIYILFLLFTDRAGQNIHKF